MTRFSPVPSCLSTLAFALLCAADARALDTTVSGRLTYGAAYRTQAADPLLLVSYNAAAAGLTGYASAGQNTDDGNLNFRRGDAATRSLKGYVDLGLHQGALSALVRIKAWHDFALADDPRSWGNNANGYAAGQPLGDNGAARLSRFSGVALGDAYVQYGLDGKAMARLGQQSLAWGERAAFVGGLGAINATDLPAVHRAGASAQEMRRPAPMLFARAGLGPAIGVEGFYTKVFRPSALDMCGTFWATTDYLAEGCNRAFAGGPAVNDRLRLANGYFIKRTASPSANDDAQFGAALTWKPAALGAEIGLYAARHIARMPIPGLVKSTRAGPALVAGDPDGKNLAYFIEYPDAVKLYALTYLRKRGGSTWSGELAYRTNQPLQLPPGDVLPAFLSPSAPSLLRADASATAPGGVFHGYDRYRAAQLQFGLQRDWGRVGAVGLVTAADVVVKHVMSLPDPAVRRYGRPDQFGSGPINGACTVTTVNAARQCSFDGYATPSAYAYRLRVEARLPQPMAGLDASVSAQFMHEVKGWSYDLLLSEGRKSMHLGVRFEYRQRYQAEVAYVPVWGGIYSNHGDRDLLALALGIKF